MTILTSSGFVEWTMLLASYCGAAKQVATRTCNAKLE